jgi:hypothetical protein
MPLGIAGASVFLIRARAQGLFEWLVQKVAGQLFLAMALFFLCGLIWAVAVPRWLEAFLASVSQRLVLALGVFFVPFAILAIWALIVG